MRAHAGAVGHVAGRLAGAAEIAFHLHVDAGDVDAPLGGLAIEVIAVTGCQGPRNSNSPPLTLEPNPPGLGGIGSDWDRPLVVTVTC